VVCDIDFLFCWNRDCTLTARARNSCLLRGLVLLDNTDRKIFSPRLVSGNVLLPSMFLHLFGELQLELSMVQKSRTCFESFIYL
jgi:hypothetical protein